MHRGIAGAGWALAGALVAASCDAPAPETNGPEPPTEPAAVPAAPPAEPTLAASEAPKPEPVPEPWQPRPEDVVTPHQPLENAEALAPLYEGLAAIDDGDKTVVRVVHLGASSIGLDDLPAIMRRKFQNRFGDGGAGLVLMKRYMANYMHRWVKITARGWQHCYIAYLCKKDGHYGLGGVTFWSDGGARTQISTRNKGLGSEASKFEVWYAAGPRGGRFDVRLDGGDPQVVSTRAEELEDRYLALEAERGQHKVLVRALHGSGRVRLYGVVLETDGPGVVWDQFSMLGAFTKRLHGWDDKHIAGQVAHRDPELIAFDYGGNDSRRVLNGHLTKKQYIDEYLKGVNKLTAGKPDGACLIVATIDRGRSLNFTILPKHMDLLVSAQREVAKQAGCAFFDAYTAMGGGGSMKKWRRKDPPLAAGDLKHLTHEGREVVGGWLYDAIITGYVEHRRAKGS